MNQNRKVRPAALLTAGIIATMTLIAASSFGQTEQTASQSPAEAHKLMAFPVRATAATPAKPHTHQVVTMKVIWGYKGDPWDARSYYLGIYFTNSTAGAPEFTFGDSYAEAAATLTEAGYTGSLTWDGGDFGGWSGNAVWTK